MFPPVDYSFITGTLLNCLTSVFCFQDPINLTSQKSWTPPNDFLHNVTPLQCHSHNDYYQSHPLYDALSYGCSSIEVDVWAFDNELYVGHYARDLMLHRTLRSLYLEPLTALLDARNPTPKPLLSQQEADFCRKDQSHEYEFGQGQKNGVFPAHPTHPLIILIDFKNNGSLILPLVQDALAPLRQKHYLTHFNGTHTIPGPVTIVATGHAPFDLLIANTAYRDIFFDAPLAALQGISPSPSPSALNPGSEDQPTRIDQYNTQTCYFASANFRRVVGHLWLPWRWSTFYPSDLEHVHGMLAEARRRGLKTRFWGAPSWPTGLRNAIWEVLVREGVDLLNGDDLEGMAEVMARRSGCGKGKK